MNKQIEERIKLLIDSGIFEDGETLDTRSAVQAISNLLDQEMVKFFDWAVEKLAYTYSDENTRMLSASELLTLYKAEMNTK